MFRQQTAYGVLRSLVGSERCIRDGPSPMPTALLVPPEASAYRPAAALFLFLVCPAVGPASGGPPHESVAYTQLTLPTKRISFFSVVPVSM